MRSGLTRTTKNRVAGDQANTAQGVCVKCLRAGWRTTVGAAVILGFPAAACRDRADRQLARAPESHAARWRNWGTIEAEIYFAVLDSLLSRRYGGDSVWYVVDSIYWWPLGTPRPRLGLEGTPAALLVVARERERAVDLVSYDQAIDSDGARRVPGPVVIFGPIDMYGSNEALLRFNLYLGLNGQEMSRIRTTLSPDGWEIVEIAPEVSK